MSPKNKKTPPPAPAASNNTALIVALSIVVLVLLIAAAIGWGLFVFQKKNTGRETPANSQGTWNRPIGNVREEVVEDRSNLNQNIAETPSVPTPTGVDQPSASPEQQEGFMPPSTSAKNMGYIKKAYTKSGKNFIDIDYIQWLTGTDAEKALREDGRCPKTGECIVYDDYYIRNQNPLIRTFEVAPDVEIRMQTLDSETTGQVGQNVPITFDRLKEIFTPPSAPQQQYEYKPFIIELSNNRIVKITEQYIP